MIIPDAMRQTLARRSARLALLGWALLLLVGCAASARPLRPGDRVDVFQVSSLAGTPYEITGGGAALWLSFWASWCYPCREEWPGLNQAQRESGIDRLRIIAISVNEPAATAAEFVRQQPAVFEVALDPRGQAAARFGVVGFPTHVLIDEDGVVRSVVRGPLSGARARGLLGIPALEAPQDP